jgi:hypothetical protein
MLSHYQQISRHYYYRFICAHCEVDNCLALQQSNMQNIAFVFVIVVFISTTMFHECRCYPSGAPIGQCENMTPQHSASPQGGASPYEIKVAQSYYVAGQNVTVSIESSTDNIKGYLIQARKVGENTAIGMFAAAPTNGIFVNCGNEKVDCAAFVNRFVIDYRSNN